LLALLVVTLAGCGGGGGGGSSPADPAVVEWTVLVYMNADNDLEQFGILNMNQMEMIGSTSRVKIIVQVDRSPSHDSSNGNWSNTRRYLITKDSDSQIIHSQLLQDMGEVDMGDPNSLRDFVEWGQQNYPASRYALVIWNHGSGWRAASAQGEVIPKAVSYDDTSNSRIETVDLPSALQADSRLDLVAFDACHMQMLEVAYEMRNSAGVIVGSEEVTPGNGYPYTQWLKRLVQNPTMSAENLGSTMVTEYVNYYLGAADVTQSAIRTDRLSAVATAADQLADALLPHADSEPNALASARNATQKYDYPDYKDLVHYGQMAAQRINDQAVADASSAVAAAVEQAVIREGHTGSSVSNSHGLSVWMPSPSEYSARSQSYGTLEFCADYGWDEWLDGQTQ
jgi:hypothetical protein